MSKICIYGIIVQLSLYSLAFAINGNAQHKSVNEIKVSFDLKSPVKLDKILESIERSTDFLFSHIDQELNTSSYRVSLGTQELFLGDLLLSISGQTDLSFHRVNNYIQIRKKEPGVEPVVEEMRMNVVVSGTVTDENGEPLPGASVIVKGATTGTITDFNGEFMLDIPENTILQITFVGYKLQEVPVGSQSTISISLEPDIAALEEVVVIGYGSVRKSDLTGAVSVLKAKDLNPGANASVDQMMQGRAAGVQISQSSSEPGGGLSIRIRGASSINAGNEPLYVIDGFPIDNSSNLSSSSNTDGSAGVGGIGVNQSPRNPLNSLNPNDIESIEILKDASATAIYGSRGANGVIMITTKKGSKDHMAVSYNTYVGKQSIAKKMDILSTDQYIDFINDVSVDQGNGEVFSTSDIASIGSGTNWQDEIYRNAMITDHNISVGGGVGNSTVYASIDYFNQKGIVRNTGMERYIGRLNFDTELSDKLKFGMILNSSLVVDKNGIDGLQTNENSGPIYASLLYDPTEPIRSGGDFARSPNLTINNPVSLIYGVSNENQTNRTLGNLYFSYDIIEGLNVKVNFGSDRQISKRDIYNSTATIYGGPVGGIANTTVLERSSYLVEYIMNYNTSINENNEFSILGGVTYQNFKSNIFGGQINGFPTDELGTANLALGNTESDQLYSNLEKNNLLSYLGRINYTLFDKFLLTGSIRADGSSRFGENNKFGYFPSFAFGYKMSKEAFVPDVFEELKLRASWGQTGNQEIGNYNSQLTFSSGPSLIIDNAILGSTQPARVANPDLKWETTTQFNIGIDASILNGRISTTLDFFSKNTTDLLFNLPLPRASGYSSILTNIGEVENKGFEVLINSTNISTSDITWSTAFNITAIRNKIVDLGPIEQIVTGAVQSVGNTAIIKVNSPLASYYGYEIDGIQQTDDPNPGDPNFVDQNDDGLITPDDQRIIGSPFPDFIYGLSNTIDYKNWSLSFFFQGLEGADLLSINAIESMYPANFRRNRLSEMALDRWTPGNTGAKWPSAVDPNSYDGDKVNTLTLQDAAYLRLKTVQIGYNVPVENVNFLSSLRLYATGQNLFTMTDYIGFDPEANSFGRSNVKVDYSSYPLARTFLVGLNVTF